MIDVNVLAGSDIRRIDGKSGKIKRVSLPWVTLEWSDGTVDNFLRFDEQLTEDVEIKTLNAGWVALGAVVGLAEKKVPPAATDDQGQEADKADKDEEEDGENEGEDAEAEEDEEEEDDEDMDENKSFDDLVNELREMVVPRPLYEASEKAKARAKAALSKAGKGKKKDDEKKAVTGGGGPGEKKTSPFYNYGVLGKHSPSKKKRSYQGIWDCSGTEGEQKCVAKRDVPKQGIKKGQVKVVKMWKGKAAYTKKYEKGRKSGKYRLPDGSKAPVKHPHYIPTGADVKDG